MFCTFSSSIVCVCLIVTKFITIKSTFKEQAFLIANYGYLKERSCAIFCVYVISLGSHVDVLVTVLVVIEINSFNGGGGQRELIQCSYSRCIAHSIKKIAPSPVWATFTIVALSDRYTSRCYAIVQRTCFVNHIDAA